MLWHTGEAQHSVCVILSCGVLFSVCFLNSHTAIKKRNTASQRVQCLMLDAKDVPRVASWENGKESHKLEGCHSKREA